MDAAQTDEILFERGQAYVLSARKRISRYMNSAKTSAEVDPLAMTIRISCDGHTMLADWRGARSSEHFVRQWKGEV